MPGGTDHENLCTLRRRRPCSGFWTEDLYPPIEEEGTVNPAIPAGVVEISDEDHARLVEYPDAWRWQNGAVVAYEPPASSPEEARAAMRPLTARQPRLGLLDAGISPSAVSVTLGGVLAGPDKNKAQIEWDYATTFDRTHPLIATVGSALGLSAD
ncbi:MAG: hypothetical protein I8N66_36260 [Ensifer sp. SSB1]|nr:hypothetical protein [Ensifer sp. SSB1]